MRMVALFHKEAIEPHHKLCRDSWYLWFETVLTYFYVPLHSIPPNLIYLILCTSLLWSPSSCITLMYTSRLDQYNIGRSLSLAASSIASLCQTSSTCLNSAQFNLYPHNSPEQHSRYQFFGILRQQYKYYVIINFPLKHYNNSYSFRVLKLSPMQAIHKASKGELFLVP